MNIVFTISSLKKESGGPSYNVANISSQLAKNIRVGIVTKINHELLDKEKLIWPSSLVDVIFVKNFKFFSLYSDLVYFKKTLEFYCISKSTQIVHDNGIWLMTNHSAAKVSSLLNIPRIVSVRGMLEPWALDYRGWKKRTAWWLYQRHDLQTARVLHATAQREAENLRRLDLRQPIAIIPNGVNLPAFSERQQLHKLSHTALFLGRIHPVKGLLNLIEAWRITQPANWKMIIAGPDEGGHRRVVVEAIRRAGLENQVELVGAVDGKDKTALFQQADLFVLPSFTENFGVVVAEALACGVPVITTRGTPWEGLLTHCCGWWIDIGIEPLAAAIREATALSDEQRRDMGQRGRQYVERDFGWPDIAQQMLSVYRWMLGQGERPDCVMND